jgi:hypothetical protein
MIGALALGVSVVAVIGAGWAVKLARDAAQESAYAVRRCNSARNLLDDVTARVDATDARLDAVERRLGGVLVTFAKIDSEPGANDDGSDGPVSPWSAEASEALR